MVLEIKLRKIGNSVGVIFPKEVLAQLKAQEGDTVCVTEAPGDCVRITRSSPAVTHQMEVVQDIIHRYRNTLRELAK